MARHIISATIDIDNEDPTRCAYSCPHLELLECRLFSGAPLIGTLDDPGPKPVRCPACLAAVPVEEVRRGR
jgi:hypothetical protein